MSRSSSSFAIALIMLGATATHARAELMVTLSNGTVNPGGTGTVDISVFSSDPLNPDTLSAFSLGLVITPNPSANALPTFDSPMTQLDPTSHSNYVFAGASLDHDDPADYPFWGPHPPTVYTGDSISAGDTSDSSNVSTSSTSYATLTSANSFLASVRFEVPGGAKLGDTYQISLLSLDTEFDDLNGDAQNYIASGGTVVVTNSIIPNVVPEPSSLLMTFVGLGVPLGCWGVRRLRKPRAISDASDRVA